LISFAEQHGLYNPKTDGKFNFHKVYGKNDTTNSSIYKNDSFYNYQRVVYLQGKYTPSSLKHPVTNGDFPVFLEPEHKLSVVDVESGLQSYYQGTLKDPYTTQNPAEKYRPISVLRTQQSHILQTRGKLPQPIANVIYLDIGMTALGVYVPFYQGAKIPEYYQLATDQADDKSAFWKFRKLQTLAMQDFPKYAPIVQAGFTTVNQQIRDQQSVFEAEYVKLYKKDPAAAQVLLDSFTTMTQKEVFGEVDKLTNQILTDMTNKVEATYHFEGA
jgi:dipeptidase